MITFVEMMSREGSSLVNRVRLAQLAVTGLLKPPMLLELESRD